jgi:hypothetical protein
MTTVTIQGNKLIVECDGNAEEIPIYRLVGCLTGSKERGEASIAVLCKKFRVLNYLFTLPKSYRPPDPLKILPGTEYVAKYHSNSTPNGDCQYLVWDDVLQPEVPLSRVCTPRREIIQLYQVNFLYRISYRSNRRIRFLNLIPRNGAAYPLVDARGKTLGSMSGSGEIDIVYWTTFIVEILPGEDRNGLSVDLQVTALEEVSPIAAVTGDICIRVPTKTCGIVSVKVATKYLDNESNARVPVPELSALSDMLHSMNRIQARYPCFENVLIIAPPACNFAVFPPEVPNIVTVPFEKIPIRIDRFLLRPYYIITMPSIIPENSVASVHAPKFDGTICSALWLSRRSIYRISYRVDVIYKGAVPETETVMWLASESGALGFCEYNPLCDRRNGTTWDTTGMQKILPNGDTMVTFDNTYRINTCHGDYFEIGIDPGRLETYEDGRVQIGEGSRITVRVEDNQECPYGNCGYSSLL